METIRKFTYIGRSIDLNYKTNKAIVVLTFLASIVGFILRLITDNTIVQSLIWSVNVAITLFFTWAINRELDPDNETSAFVAVGFALLPMYFWGGQNVLVLVWIMLVLRLINRTTGLKPKVTDAAFILALSGWLTFTENIIFSVFTFAAFLLDGLLPRPDRKQYIFAAGSLILFVAAYLMEKTFYHTVQVLWPAIYISIVLGVMFVPVILLTQKVKSVGDATKIQLLPVRIRAACWLGLFIALYFSLFLHGWGFKMTYPLWAAIAGCIAYRYYCHLTHIMH